RGDLLDAVLGLLEGGLEEGVAVAGHLEAQRRVTGLKDALAGREPGWHRPGIRLPARLEVRRLQELGDALGVAAGAGVRADVPQVARRRFEVFHLVRDGLFRAVGRPPEVREGGGGGEE